MQENSSCLLISSCYLCCWSLGISRALVLCSRESKSSVWGEGQYHEFTLPPSSAFLLYVSILVWVKTSRYVTNLNTACVYVCATVWNSQRLTWLADCSRAEWRPPSSSSLLFLSSLSTLSPGFAAFHTLLLFSLYLSIQLILYTDRCQFWSPTLQVDALLIEMGVGGVTL